MDPTSTVLIVNPAAAGGRVGREWDDILPGLRAVFGAIEVVQTAAQGDATRLARRSVEEGRRTVLSLGGDGTHNEVVNGILQAQPEAGSVTFGILPSGTGGDLRRLMKEPDDMQRAARALRDDTPHPVDVGHVAFVDDDGRPAERFFVNLLSFGLGGLVDRMVNRSSKRLGGRVTFALATARALASYRPATLALTIDGTDVGTFSISNVAVANGRYFGGGMNIAPNARLGDGLFDVVVIPDTPLWQAARDARRLYNGTIANAPGVRTFSGATITATPAGPGRAWLDIDGEAPGVAPLTCTLRSGAISMIGCRPEVL